VRDAKGRGREGRVKSEAGDLRGKLLQNMQPTAAEEEEVPNR